MRWIVVTFIALTSAACNGPSGFKEHGQFVRDHIVNNHEVTANYLDVEDFQLHYRETGNAKKAVAVWVHGTPGSWTDGAYLVRDAKFTSDVKLVMLDRPGWGESQYHDDPRTVTSFKEIGRLIKPLLSQLKTAHPDVPLVLIGFSWGGSVVPSIAIDYPELVDGVLVLSGGLDPDLTMPRWYNKFASTALGNAVIGEGMRKANVEMYALSPQLSILHDRWPELLQPIIVVQGDSDKLVDPKNADYAESVLSQPHSQVIRLEDQGHMLKLERIDLVARCVVALAAVDLDSCS